MTTTDNTTTMTTTSTKTDDSLYKGPVKMIWKDGQRIQVPDYELLNDPAASIASTSSPSASSYIYQKTISDVISEEDKTRFKNLRTDEEKYDFRCSQTVYMLLQIIIIIY